MGTSVKYFAKYLLSAALVTLWSVQIADATPILANGSFEGSVLGAYFSTSDSTGAWTLSNATIINAPALATFGSIAAEGSDSGVQFGVLNFGGSAGTISQTFATTAGQEYAVSFYQNQFYTGQFPQNPASVTLTASVVNQPDSLNLSSNAYTYTNLGLTPDWYTDPTWVQRNFDFVATGTSTILSFIGSTSSFANFGQAIDDVVVTSVAVPEPGSLLMLGLSTVGLLAFARRRPCASR